MCRILSILLLVLAFGWASPVLADVNLSFHSFNGSVLVGRYPHAFIVLEGELENGQNVNENYGFTAKSVGPSVLNGPVEHDILVEKPHYISSTNRHFTVTITDEQYRKIVAEVKAWRDAPGKYYDLETRNCIHFVGAIAKIVELKVEYPKGMLRRPKKWLNYITSLNPSLGTKIIK
ncbi:hypothetical protein [Altererythrobacter litoralis]|uniref:DUF4105 domain-containing protein n=1 Tax=Altererythrobacter litoralis TaxID=3113904 RepID=A0ABU7GGG7_9SPHN|nr:hypothetical protein [Erythrobacteraceae bacterium 1XM1-14]